MLNQITRPRNDPAYSAARDAGFAFEREQRIREQQERLALNSKGPGKDDPLDTEPA
jgi:hypothetical protein